ncbi:MAG: hypothetical protein KKE79_00770 [Actinobacteria bacterium]|nr:hypothetical protein [Actinomycetota bacterium]MCG2795262.1 hypothetical protein [Actinomycetes bacterium]MBU4241559.1 hypothetical protein [Actinomycetota bacterium]MBU4301222.1 hypothetical protein [Actinomycetota bacterium]MBU4386553.1 hypothetical protein [Actinomycetota bacterium]
MVRAKLNLPWFGQVGIVVRDVGKAMGYYRDTFGLGPWAVFEGAPGSRRR